MRVDSRMKTAVSIKKEALKFNQLKAMAILVLK
jgi:hypothetical protein